MPLLLVSTVRPIQAMKQWNYSRAGRRSTLRTFNPGKFYCKHCVHTVHIDLLFEIARDHVFPQCKTISLSVTSCSRFIGKFISLIWSRLRRTTGTARRMIRQKSIGPSLVWWEGSLQSQRNARTSVAVPRTITFRIGGMFGTFLSEEI